MTQVFSAVQRMKDEAVRYIGFDCARQMGLLGSYMEMMNRGGSGGYSRPWILAAKIKPGTDPLPRAKVGAKP